MAQPTVRRNQANGDSGCHHVRHGAACYDLEGGQDIEDCSETGKSQLYVERLQDDLEKGLFAKRTSEDSIRNWKIKKLVRICFTEIRLSQAQTHAERYGKLGIGFTRDFIMNKGGRPVIYVPFHAGNDGRLLEDSIRNVYEKSNDNDEIHRSARWIMAHVKRMSNGKGEDYYEEMEWRLVHDEKSTHFAGCGSDVYRLRFEASDIRVIIFPDEITKQQSLSNKFSREYFSEHLPIMATLDECSSF
jgi:hypothetical protein